MGRFEIRDNFYLDGKPFRVISGSIHYFRVVPEYWRDRLEKLKAMGCNTVETYIAWNVHEPRKGEFCFDGGYDLVKFVKTAQDLGLYVILRPLLIFVRSGSLAGFQRGCYRRMVCACAPVTSPLLNMSMLIMINCFR